MSAGIAGLEQVLDDATLAEVNARGDRLRIALDEVARPAGLHVSGRGSLMTIHPAPHPIVMSTPLTDAQAAGQGAALLLPGQPRVLAGPPRMLTVSIPVTDDMCDDLVAAFAEVVETHREAFAALPVRRCLTRFLRQVDDPCSTHLVPRMGHLDGAQPLPLWRDSIYN